MESGERSKRAWSDSSGVWSMLQRSLEKAPVEPETATLEPLEVPVEPRSAAVEQVAASVKPVLAPVDKGSSP